MGLNKSTAGEIPANFNKRNFKMEKKLYKFDAVYNHFKDLTDKEEIRQKLDAALQKSYEKINAPYYREYEFAYAYAHLSGDYDKVYGLLGNIDGTYGEYFDYRLKNAYAIKAIFSDSEETKAGVLKELQMAEQMALEDNQDSYFFHFGRWKEFIIAYQELLDDMESSSRCIRHSISRYRRMGDIRDILAIANAYKYFGDTTKAMYYMNYACAVAKSALDKHYIADCWAVNFGNYDKCKLWSSKAVNHEQFPACIYKLNYDKRNELLYDSSYLKFCDMIYSREAVATDVIDWIECAKLWEIPKFHPENLRGKKYYCIDKAFKAITHPQQYISIINYYSDKVKVWPEEIIEAMTDFLNKAQDIPLEHLGYLWLDCAEVWKTLGNKEKFEECFSRSDVSEDILDIGPKDDIPF